MKWLAILLLCSGLGGYLYFLASAGQGASDLSVQDQRLERLQSLARSRQENPNNASVSSLTTPDSIPLEAPVNESYMGPDYVVLDSLDGRLREFERQVANMQPGEFEYLARQVLSLEDQIALRDSGHLEIQANIAVLLGNAVEFELVPKTDVFIEHQKIAWTYGMDAYRAINFLEQNQFGRLLSQEEMQREIESPGFESFKSSFPKDFPIMPDETRAELYQRVLDARDDPSIPPFVPLAPTTER